MTAADRRMAARRSSPCMLLIIVLDANREHRRDAYATLGSATCLTPWPPTVHVVRHSTKLLSLTLSLVDFLDSSSPIALATLRAAPCNPSSECPNSRLRLRRKIPLLFGGQLG